MVVNLFRSFLALTGFGLMSFTFTFWSHHQWELVLHGHEGNRQYHALRQHVHSTLETHPVLPSVSSRASDTSTYRVNSNHDTTTTTTEPDQVPPVIHIVYTRFMQHQPDLMELGLARIELLKEFFVQSLQGRTTPNFLVVIRTDPQLQPSVQQPLLTLFPNATDSPYQFRYLVIGSNNNPPSHQYAHLVQLLEPRNGESDGTDHQDQIWSGTIQQAKDYLMIGSTVGSRIILETRLDSDDGLHAEYLERLQHQARDTFQTTTTTTTTNPGSWRMWCANKYLEWQYMAPWDLKRKHHSSNAVWKQDDRMLHKRNDTEKQDDHDSRSRTMDHETKLIHNDSSALGALIVSRFGGCLSAGITLAYLAVGPQESITTTTTIELPSLQRHETLATTIPHCKEESNSPQQQRDDPPSKNCLTMIQLNPAVVRARTPTSAGMMNIFWDWESSTRDKSDKKTKEKQDVAEPSQPLEHGQDASSSSSPESSLQQGVELTRAYRVFQKLALQQQPYQEKLWLLVPHVFGMTPTRLRALRDYLTRHMTGIAKENLMGQCSQGHSCKDSSQVMLRKIVAAET